MTDLAENREVSELDKYVYSNGLVMVSTIGSVKYGFCHLMGTHAVFACFHIKHHVPRFLAHKVLTLKINFVIEHCI